MGCMSTPTPSRSPNTSFFVSWRRSCDACWPKMWKTAQVFAREQKKVCWLPLRSLDAAHHLPLSFSLPASLTRLAGRSAPSHRALPRAARSPPADGQQQRSTCSIAVRIGSQQETHTKEQPKSFSLGPSATAAAAHSPAPASEQGQQEGDPRRHRRAHPRRRDEAVL